MLKFTLILVAAAIIGIQLGIYAVLTQRGISKIRSFLYSFMIYLMPLVIIISHIQLYKDRHELLIENKLELGLSAERLKSLKDILDSRIYITVSIVDAIKDIVTPKDNLQTLLEAIIKYEKKPVTIKVRIKTFEKIGFWGLSVKTFRFVTESMKIHAWENYIEDKIEKKLVH